MKKNELFVNVTKISHFCTKFFEMEISRNTIEQAFRRYLEASGGERMDLRAVMFDMDGVLFDSMRNHARSWYETMVHFGFGSFSVDEAYMHEGRTGAGTINIVSQRERGRDATAEEIEEIYAYKSSLFTSLPKAERMPSAYELLCQVRNSGVTPMIVTGSGQVSLLERLNRNFPDIFHTELMVTAFDVKYGKPSPEPYLIGMEKYAKAKNETVAPCNFLVVENAPLGVQSGVASGVFTIAVNTGPLPDSVLIDQGANLLFDSMQHLADSWQLLHECADKFRL